MVLYVLMWIAKDCAEKNQIHRAIREAKYLRPAGMQLMVTSRFLEVLAVLVAWRQVSHWRQEFEKAQAQRDAFRRFGQPGGFQWEMRRKGVKVVKAIS